MATKKMFTVVTGEVEGGYPGDFTYGFLCESCATEAEARTAQERFSGRVTVDGDTDAGNLCACGRCDVVVDTEVSK